MKIVCVLGSPREKSNSSTIAKRFLNAAEEMGAKVKSYTLNDLKYRGCQACMACKTKIEKCALKDDLTEVLQAIQDSDVLVMASPVYYGDVSGQLKLCIDRTYSFLSPDYVTTRLAPGKKLVFILVQGEPDEKSYSDIFPKYDSFMKWNGAGIKESHLIRACGVIEAGEIEKRRDILTLAEEVARKVCSDPV